MYLSLLNPSPSTKRRIFLSFQHSLDRWAYQELTRVFCDAFDIFEDNSPERAKNSDDPTYIMRSLRENHIVGSSCTIVLCGYETRWRKYVDWEIKDTLGQRHGLIGVSLPTCSTDYRGWFHVPDRLSSFSKRLRLQTRNQGVLSEMIVHGCSGTALRHGRKTPWHLCLLTSIQGTRLACFE
jgi:MTH538 TIR-like domain (DUF1863)